MMFVRFSELFERVESGKRAQHESHFEVVSRNANQDCLDVTPLSFDVFPLVLLSFPSLTSGLRTGSKAACLFKGFRSRSTSCSSSFLLLSLCAPTVFPAPVIR